MLFRSITVDISGLENIGDAIRVSSLNLPDNITVHAEPEDVIVSISGVSASAEVEEEETAVDEAEPEVVEKGKKTEEE